MSRYNGTTEKEIENIDSERYIVEMISLKRNFFRSIATKKLPSAVMKSVKKIGAFALKQLKHLAVGNFIQNQTGILAALGFNSEVAASAMAARKAQAGANIVETTIHHYAR